MEQNIQIAVRIKPTQQSLISPLYDWDTETIQIADRNTFSYDYVLPPNASQQQVFQKIGFKIISNVLQGYNGCIFAYGQTGSGKTYTMTGYDPQQGIIQKCLKTLWNCVNKSDFSQIKLSYFQIYNQTIKDLLSDKQNLVIRENAKSGFYIQGLTQKIIEKYEDFQHLISHGISVRTVKQTKMNQTSSRSHSVLQVNVAYQKRQQRGLSVLKHAKITFIDLAGSQKQKQTQVQGQRLKQAANINKSLSNLSLVISKLSQISQKKSANQANQSTVHVPYRNSVLTKILKNSLTGKSKIIIICTISLDERFLDETLSTLRFAQTAKSIKMKVKKNQEEFDGTKQRLFQQFQEFKNRYNELKQSFQQSQRTNESLKRQNAQLKDEIEKRQAELNELQINYECLKIQSLQVVRQIKSQSINPQMSQASVFQSVKRSQNNHCKSQTQFRVNGKEMSQRQMNFREASFDNRCFNNSSAQNIFNPVVFSSNSVRLPSSSQLSFFTTNLSSQFCSPQKSFFTIDQADQKQQVDHSSQFFKTQQKLRFLQKQVQKYQVQREFFMMEINLKQEQIKQLLKRNVFLQQKEKEIHQGHNMFAELIQNKQFSHAQMKFLKLCLQKFKKDKMAFQLIQQENNNQKVRFFQSTQKVKQLLLKYVQNNGINEGIFVQETFSNKIFSKSSAKNQRLSENFERQNTQKVSERMAGSQKQQQKLSNENLSKIFSQSSGEKQSNLSYQQINFTPENKKKVTQGIVKSQMSQSMGMMGSLMQQSSQIPLFMLQNRSMMSQSSYKFTNNELEFLKKDYDRLNQELKNMKEELQRKNIMLIEKESLLVEKQREFEQLVDRNQKLIQDIIAQNEVRQLQKRKKRTSADYQSIQKQLNQKQTQLRHLKKHLQEKQKKHQQQLNTLRLSKKAIQTSLQRHVQAIEQLKNQISHNQQTQQKLKQDNQKLNGQIKQLREELRNIQIDKGFLDSQNQFLNTKYNQLKVFIKQNKKVQTPKKVYKERVSCYSLSQSQQRASQVSKSQNIGRKSTTQLSQQQCIQVIQAKRHEHMYIAAYYFYRETEKLHAVRQLLQKKLKQYRDQLNKSHGKLRQLQNQRIQAVEKALQLQRIRIDSKQLVLDNRQKQLQLRTQILQKKQQISNLQMRNKQLLQRCQILQAKLLERQHKEFENRQKVNDLTTQIRENSIVHQTPLNNNQKIRFNHNRRISSSSHDSLSSDSTVIRPSSFINNESRKSVMSHHSRKSIQMPRNYEQFQQDQSQAQDIYSQIQQLSNQESKQQKTHFYQSSSPSIISKTITNNSNSIQMQRKSKRFLQPYHTTLRSNNQQPYLSQFQFQQTKNNNNPSKSISIKSDSHQNVTNLFKQHKNKDKYSKS